MTCEINYVTDRDLPSASMPPSPRIRDEIPATL
jgi:hypothetical protein